MKQVTSSQALAGERETNEAEIQSLLGWLKEFHDKNGRSLRVLHVGNIANNAYLNVKFLRSVGVVAHVVSHDYQHVMGTPEWEEVELLHDYGDDFFPVFSKHDLRGYRRPEWFISGPLAICTSQVEVLRGRAPSKFVRAIQFVSKRLPNMAMRLFGARAGYAVNLLITSPRLLVHKAWSLLTFSFNKLFRSRAGYAANFLTTGPRLLLRMIWRAFRFLFKVLWTCVKVLWTCVKVLWTCVGYAVKLLVTNTRRLIFNIWSVLRSRYGAQNRVLNLISKRVRRIKLSCWNVFKLVTKHARRIIESGSKLFGDASREGKFDLDFAIISRQLITLFKQVFPTRSDQLTDGDIAPHLFIINHFHRMFGHYDIVQCYATEPLYALLSGKRPYVAFEHGTLRHFTTEDNPLHRMTALSYRQADHTFITNGDCLAYAQNLGIKNYSAIVHPVDVDQHRQDFSDEARHIREELNADVLIFCPVRHDYLIKGTDRAVEALPLIKQRTRKRVVMVMCAWGTQLEESRARIEKLGCTDNVVWRNVMSRITMIKYIHAADVVFDQFVLPVFGSTAPQAIAAGRPVLASYVASETAWLIPEPAPIVSVFTPEEIADRTIECLDPEWLRDYQLRARHWIDTYHSPSNVVQEHLRVYRDILENTEDLAVNESIDNIIL